MEHWVSIRNNFLGIFTALLILSQGLWAATLPDPYMPLKDKQPEKAEVQKNISAKAAYIDVSPRLEYISFLFYWLTKTYSLASAPSIYYQNCQAFFVHPSSFNSYYTHLSALAP